MALVRSRDSKPEMILRRMIHALGYRYRLHRRDLPGTPDLVFPSRRKAIFVHGCFWHRHNCPLGNRMPKSRVDFWAEKFNANRLRDQRNLRRLRRDGWAILVVWECQIRPSNLDRLQKKIVDFLTVR